MVKKLIDIGPHRGVAIYDDAEMSPMKISAVPDDSVLLAGGGLGQFDPSLIGGGGGGVGDVNGPGAGTVVGALATFANTLGTDIQQSRVGSYPVLADATNQLKYVVDIWLDETKWPSGPVKLIEQVGGFTRLDALYKGGATEGEPLIWAAANPAQGGQGGGWAPGTVDISAHTNLAGGTGLTLSGDTMNHDSHTGDATGATALTLASAAITGKATATPVSGDFFLFSDTGSGAALKKADFDTLGGGDVSRSGATSDNAIARWHNSGADIQTSLLFISDVGSLTAGNGTVALPTYSWTADPNSGMYRVGADHIGFSVGGGQEFGMTTNMVYIPAITFFSVWGNATNYGIQMSNGTNFNYGSVTGYSIKSTCYGVASNYGWTWGAYNTVPVASLNSNTGDFQVKGWIRNEKGTVGVPARSFYDDTDTGEYWYAANAIGWSCGGVVEMLLTTTHLYCYGYVNAEQVLFRPRATGTASEGMQIYDSDLSKMTFYNGKDWETITSAV